MAARDNQAWRRRRLLGSFVLQAGLRYSWASGGAGGLLSLRQFVAETYGAGSFARVREALRKQHDIVLPPSIVLGM